MHECMGECVDECKVGYMDGFMNWRMVGRKDRRVQKIFLKIIKSEINSTEEKCIEIRLDKMLKFIKIFIPSQKTLLYLTYFTNNF